MNHIPMKVTASSVATKPTRRALAKQRTRESILAAARALFAERGYEGATIRDIARAAGMSTGAVFANFADKAELFDEIVTADYRAVEDQMGRAAQAARTVDAALEGMFGAAYRFHLDQLQLTRASLSVSWTRDEETERRNRLALRPIFELLQGVLDSGVRRGELKAGGDLDLVSAMLWEAYVAGYRGAVFDARPAEELTARFGERAQVILAGVRA